MVDSKITVNDQVDGSGTANVDTKSLVGAGGKTVHRQVVNIGDPTTFSQVAQVNANGELKVKQTDVVPVNDNGGSLTVDNANLDVALSTRLSESTFTTRINTQGQKTMAGSTPVVIASDQTTIPVSENKTSSTSSTPAQTSVGTTSAQILAANASRKRVMIQNTGTTVIKLNLGTATVTQTAYHVALQSCSSADAGDGGSYIDEMWTGAIQAISSAAGGTVVITELT